MLSLFIQFLCVHKHITASRVAAYGQWQPGSREPFGSIALRYGLLNMTQVDEVLMKKDRLERFGETAARLGYLGTNEVERVLIIQSMQDLDDFIGWALVHGLLDSADLVSTMREFWAWLAETRLNPWERLFGPIQEAAAPAGVAIAENASG